MSRVALILLLALAVLAVAWGFSHVAPPAPDAARAPQAQRRAPVARAGGVPSPPRAGPPRASRAAGAGGVAASTGGLRHGDQTELAADAPSATGATDAPAPLRDLFSYAGEREPLSAPTAGSAPDLAPDAPTAAPEATPTPRPVRLVGFVRQAGQLRAALRVHGEVVLATPGERVGDYAVLTLDEDAGVRLRGPDGAEFTLRPER